MRDFLQPFPVFWEIFSNDIMDKLGKQELKEHKKKRSIVKTSIRTQRVVAENTTNRL